jgi:hypothetical protein
VDVHANTIGMVQGHTGLVHDNEDPQLYRGGGNRFEQNSYFLGCNRRPFAWSSSRGASGYAYVTRESWVAAGNDAASHFESRCER